MAALDKRGYSISIHDWVGNLGNHIIQLAGALNVAKKTESKLRIPKHALLKRRTYDFRNSANENCNEPLAGRFFFQTDCFQYPIVFDRDRRDIFQRYVYDVLNRISVPDRLRSLGRAQHNNFVTPETLVINMRSGRDIFRVDPPPQNDYMQPPLSFYKHIIKSHGYDDCLIVTEADRMNPCIQELVKWNPRIRIKRHQTVADDARTILSARQLVLCHSTFSWCLALMSKTLKTLYQPATFQIRGVRDFLIDTYDFQNYIKPGEWRGTDDQRELMVNHSERDLTVKHSDAVTTGPSDDPEPSSLW